MAIGGVGRSRGVNMGHRGRFFGKTSSFFSDLGLDGMVFSLEITRDSGFGGGRVVAGAGLGRGGPLL